jgi:hypothetical protein
MRLHPLEDRRRIARHIEEFGVIPDMTRGTGRSTALALQCIARAIENPHSCISVTDHFHTAAADRMLLGMVVDMIAALGLRSIYVSRATNRIRFGASEDSQGISDWTLC